ncbi:hypothetical protein LCGC14_0967400 [marine sediment metagenome]|uniref:Uncharacterized protein n=1 Tax=marine sediment metagenome TaxID=412755 RepID=A0A0F9QW11_9ZZZZ|nr:hypothetical protein [Candidatus Aminicenantes bacterium]
MDEYITRKTARSRAEKRDNLLKTQRKQLFCWNIKLGAYFLNLSEYFDVEDKFQEPVDSHK